MRIWQNLFCLLLASGAGAAPVAGPNSGLYFVDRRGMLRAMMPFGRPAADIAHDVRLLLRN